MAGANDSRRPTPSSAWMPRRKVDRPIQEPGVCWEQQPQLQSIMTFPAMLKGRAIPYAIYDPGKNRGFVVVGTSRKAPICSLKIEAMVRQESRTEAIPEGDGHALLILDDSGGEKCNRARGWKNSLTTATRVGTTPLAAASHGLSLSLLSGWSQSITAGTSLLFSQISNNCCRSPSGQL